MILSNINVHIEQNPHESIFFDPYNSNELAEILLKKWNEHEGGPDIELENYARAQIETRTKSFARSFQKIVLELVKN